jgi:glucokinase
VKRIVTTDIGGTHARFAIAKIDSRRVVELGEPVTLKTNEHASFEIAWAEFGRRFGSELPGDLAIAVAGPTADDVFKLTNNPWVIGPAALKERLGLRRLTVINDFGAVAHAVAVLDAGAFIHQCGPDIPLPRVGVTTVIGPGTGLGVAALLSVGDGHYHVIETEGGHVDFAPLDSLEDRILGELRRNFRRVSVERLVSGRGLFNIYEALALIERRPIDIRDDKDLWAAALTASDSLAAAALERLCMALGAFAGDVALAQGAASVVISGALALKLSDYLPRSGFHERFIAKGRFERRMTEIPIKLVTHPEPGLFGAAAAFARDHM